MLLRGSSAAVSLGVAGSEVADTSHEGGIVGSVRCMCMGGGLLSLVRRSRAGLGAAGRCMGRRCCTGECVRRVVLPTAVLVLRDTRGRAVRSIYFAPVVVFWILGRMVSAVVYGIGNYLRFVYAVPDTHRQNF